MRSGWSMLLARSSSRCGTRSTFICAARDQRLGGVDLEQRRVPGPERRVELAQAGHARLAVLLEEQLAGDALGRAHQRHRPVREVRQHPLGDALVVAHQVELGQAGRRVDHALGIRHLDARRRRRRGAVHAAPARPAALAPSRASPSLAGLSARRPWKTAWRTWPSGVQSRERTSATSSGLTQRSPPAVRRDQRPGLTRLGIERRLGDLELRQPRVQVAPGLRVPAGADVAGVAAARRPRRDSRAAGCRPRRAALARSVKPHDHELLALLALQLQPGLGAAGDVGRVGALGDDAFEAHAAAPPRASAPASAVEVCAEAHAVAARCASTSCAQQRAARAQRHLAQVVAVEVRQVEHEVDDRLACATLSKAFCRALKSGTPCVVHARRSRRRARPTSRPSASTAAASAGIFAVQSWPLRVISRALPPSMRAISR